MAFAQAFKDICGNPWGEALQPRVKVRLPNDTLVTIADADSIVGINPITRKRARKFGVVQGQNWQFRVVDQDLSTRAIDMVGGWAKMEIGFPDANLWESVAVGRIDRVSASTGLVVTVEVTDVLAQAMNYKLPRDIFFSDSGWGGNVHVKNKADDSKSYNNDWDDDGEDEGVLLYASGDNCLDETIVLEFTSATDYKAVYEDGSESIGYDIATTEIIPNSDGDNAILVVATGWSTDIDAYASGDEFQVFTAQKRTAATLNPVAMAKHLLDDVAELQTLDIEADTWGSAIYDSAGWDALAGDYSADRIAGFFARGTKIIDIIQDALKLVHGSVYPTNDGKIGLWLLQPTTPSGETLNGDPDAGQVDIISGSFSDDFTDTANRVTYQYLDLESGDEASYEKTNTSSSWDEDLHKVVKSNWRVHGPTVEAAVNKYLNRFANARKIYKLNTTLMGASVELDGGCSFTEPLLLASNMTADVDSLIIDIMGNKAALELYNDPVSELDYAVVGTTVVGSTTELVW